MALPHSEITKHSVPTAPATPRSFNDKLYEIDDNFVYLEEHRAGSFAVLGDTNGYEYGAEDPVTGRRVLRQWGECVGDAASQSVIVTFPIPFPHAVRSIVGSHRGGGGAMFIVDDEDFATTPWQFKARITNVIGGHGTGAFTAYWQAIGE